MTTGEMINKRRKELGLSAEWIAENLKVSPATVYRYENGDIQKIPLEKAKQISQLLGIDILSIVDFDTASDLIFQHLKTREDYINNPPDGLTAEDVEVAYDYHDLGSDAKRIVKSIIQSEKKAVEEELRQHGDSE